MVFVKWMHTQSFVVTTSKVDSQNKKVIETHVSSEEEETEEGKLPIENEMEEHPVAVFDDEQVTMDEDEVEFEEDQVTMEEEEVFETLLVEPETNVKAVEEAWEAPEPVEGSVPNKILVNRIICEETEETPQQQQGHKDQGKPQLNLKKKQELPRVETSMINIQDDEPSTCRSPVETTGLMEPSAKKSKNRKNVVPLLKIEKTEPQEMSRETTSIKRDLEEPQEEEETKEEEEEEGLRRASLWCKC